MIRSLSGSWKQPVSYFFTSGVMNADIIESKLKDYRFYNIMWSYTKTSSLGSGT